MTDQPCGEWVRRVTLPLVDAFDGLLLGHRYLIHDRDPLFDGSFVSPHAKWQMDREDKFFKVGQAR